MIAQVRGLVDRGYREAVLTGVDITEYGRDRGGRGGGWARWRARSCAGSPTCRGCGCHRSTRRKSTPG